jgi:hypothetical protein
MDDPIQHDRIRLEGTRLKSFADVLKHAVQTHEGVLVSLGSADSIMLVGAQESGLRASDFVFA